MLVDRGEPTGLSDVSIVGDYLFEDLVAMGTTKLLPMLGEVPLDWSDIWFYHKATDRLASSKERLIVRQLSEAYTLGKLEGMDPLNIAPVNRLKDE